MVGVIGTYCKLGVLDTGFKDIVKLFVDGGIEAGSVKARRSVGRWEGRDEGDGKGEGYCDPVWKVVGELAEVVFVDGANTDKGVGGSEWGGEGVVNGGVGVLSAMACVMVRVLRIECEVMVGWAV